MAAITAAAIGVAGSIYTQNKAKKAQQEQNQFIAEQQRGTDPYAAYRTQAAKQLSELSGPTIGDITKSPEWAARMQAAERTVSAQGYTGSGNALVAAAGAGADVYQQAWQNAQTSYQAEFDRLARLSGADVGLQTAAGLASSAISGRQAGSDTSLSATGGVVNNLTNLATVAGGSFNQSLSAAQRLQQQEAAVIGGYTGSLG